MLPIKPIRLWSKSELIKEVEKMKTADQFKRVEFQGQKAAEGFSAILDADGVDVAIIAPTLDALDEVWQRFHVRPVDRDRAEKVLIFKAPEESLKILLAKKGGK